MSFEDGSENDGDLSLGPAISRPRFEVGGEDGGVAAAVNAYLHEKAQRDLDELRSRTGARYGIMDRREDR